MPFIHRRHARTNEARKTYVLVCLASHHYLARVETSSKLPFAQHGRRFRTSNKGKIRLRGTYVGTTTILRASDRPMIWCVVDHTYGGRPPYQVRPRRVVIAVPSCVHACVFLISVHACLSARSLASRLHVYMCSSHHCTIIFI